MDVVRRKDSVRMFQFSYISISIMSELNDFRELLAGVSMYSSNIKCQYQIFKTIKFSFSFEPCIFLEIVFSLFQASIQSNWRTILVSSSGVVCHHLNNVDTSNVSLKRWRFCSGTITVEIYTYGLYCILLSSDLRSRTVDQTSVRVFFGMITEI